MSHSHEAFGSLSPLTVQAPGIAYGGVAEYEPGPPPSRLPGVEPRGAPDELYCGCTSSIVKSPFSRGAPNSLWIPEGFMLYGQSEN